VRAESTDPDKGAIRANLKTLVGIVGYSPVLDTFPLGPHLMAKIDDEFTDDQHEQVTNFTWSPLHIVQQFQDMKDTRPDRVIIVGTSSVCRQPGRVQAFRWIGGKQAELELQPRVYEAVTGVVDMENTLAIGSYFEVWPERCITVEVDLPADLFGCLVLADNEGVRDDIDLQKECGFSPADTLDKIATRVLSVAKSDAAQLNRLPTKSVNELEPLVPFARNFTLDTEKPPGIKYDA